MLCDFFFTGDWWQRLSWGISWYMVLWRHLVCADGGLLTFWWTKSHDFVQKGIWPYLHLSFYLSLSYVTCGLTCAMCFNLPSDGLFSLSSLQIHRADFTCPAWVSPSARKLILKILDPNPKTVSLCTCCPILGFLLPYHYAYSSGRCSFVHLSWQCDASDDFLHLR